MSYAVTAPVSYTGPVVGAWMMAGVVVLIILVRRRHGRTAETARVPLDATPSSDLRQNGAVQP
ncbi:hypothetical protein [Streptomyces avermitilis]|uniref:hypothetical protein n=1 Tax=Streptomyces avermitilis TaxID=33903 RepID=UPI0033B84571